MVAAMQPVVGMELVDLRAALGPAEPAFRARQVYDAVYRRRVTELSAISTIPKVLRDRLARELALGLPTVSRRYDSVDGTLRYLLELGDGKTVETVWMPEFGDGPPNRARQGGDRPLMDEAHASSGERSNTVE